MQHQPFGGVDGSASEAFAAVGGMSEFDPVSYIMGAKSAGGGGGVPAVTADDIGKSLMVQEVKHYTPIVPPQTVTIPAYDPEDPQNTVMIEMQAENTNLFVADVILRETIIQDGETLQYNDEPTFIDAGYVWAIIFCKDIATNKVYFVASPGAEPLELTVSLDKETTSTAEWGKQYAVMISKGTQDADTGVYTFDKTYNEVLSALRIMPVIFITDYDGDYPNQYFADYAHIQNGKYRIRLLNNVDEFMSDTEDGFLMWNPG